MGYQKAATYQPDNQEPHRSTEPEKRQPRHTPKHYTHVDCTPLRPVGLILADLHSLQTARTQYDSCEGEITKHPDQHNSTSETLIIVFLVFGFRNNLYFLWSLHCNDTHLGVVLGVQVAIVLGDIDVHLAAGLEVCRGQLFSFVVSFRAPCYVVCVAESVDVENVDVGGS